MSRHNLVVKKNKDGQNYVYYCKKAIFGPCANPIDCENAIEYLERELDINEYKQSDKYLKHRSVEEIRVVKEEKGTISFFRTSPYSHGAVQETMEGATIIGHFMLVDIEKRHIIKGSWERIPVWLYHRYQIPSIDRLMLFDMVYSG